MGVCCTAVTAVKLEWMDGWNQLVVFFFCFLTVLAAVLANKDADIDDLIESADDALFKQIIADPNYVLAYLLQSGTWVGPIYGGVGLGHKILRLGWVGSGRVGSSVKNV